VQFIARTIRGLESWDGNGPRYMHNKAPQVQQSRAHRACGRADSETGRDQVIRSIEPRTLALSDRATDGQELQAMMRVRER
jgi:hypothetical protein